MFILLFVVNLCVHIYFGDLCAHSILRSLCVHTCGCGEPLCSYLSWGTSVFMLMYIYICMYMYVCNYMCMSMSLRPYFWCGSSGGTSASIPFPGTSASLLLLRRGLRCPYLFGGISAYVLLYLYVCLMYTMSVCRYGYI